MSYARFGWGGSDVYVYLDVGGYLTCCGCLLEKREWVDDPSYPLLKGYTRPTVEIETRFTTTDALIEHLRRHVVAGHTVPKNVIPELEADRQENEAFIAERHDTQET